MSRQSGARSLAALASATSANGTKREGAALNLNTVDLGTVGVEVSTTIVTGSVVNTITFEVSNDNSTWTLLRDANNTAPTTITATATRAVTLPPAVHAWQFVRVCCTLSGAATAAGDLTAATYRYVARGYMQNV